MTLPYFEGIDLHHTLLPDGIRWSEVLRLVLLLLGSAYEDSYLVFPHGVEWEASQRSPTIAPARRPINPEPGATARHPGYCIRS